MLKRCQHCDAEYWARWRNEDVTLCPPCRGQAVVCTACAMIVTPPRDPLQLVLFPISDAIRPRLERPSLEERYWSLRAKASQATRRKYPYC